MSDERPNFEAYTYLSYFEIRQKLQRMADDFPDLVSLSNAQDEFGIKHRIDCVDPKNPNNVDSPCKTDILTLTNKREKQAKKQVLVLGGMNGDETVGPNVAIYFIEYFCSLHRNGEQLQRTRINQLLDQVEIIVVPMPNAPAYNYGEENERLTEAAKIRMRDQFSRTPKNFVDIQEDFPIDLPSDEDCLNGVTTRILFKLITTNQFATVVSLHGGGNNIVHPWGTFYRSLRENGFYTAYRAPDSYSFRFVGEKMRHSASTIVYIKDAQASAIKYQVGSAATRILPKNGNFEDWAYSASWTQDDGTLASCKPVTYPLEDDGITFQGSGRARQVRALPFLVETATLKQPPEDQLGGRIVKQNGSIKGRKGLNISGIFTNEDVVQFAKGSQLNGHINRNIRLLVSLIQTTQPAIELLGFSEAGIGSFDGGSVIAPNEIKLYWRVLGCADRIEGAGYKFNPYEKFRLERKASIKMLCFWEGDQHDKERKSTVFVTKISRTEEEITLQAISDLRMGLLENSSTELPVKPESVKRARSLFSQSREKVIELDVSVSEVLDRETGAIDFTGTNVAQFCDDNGLELVERRILRVGNEDSLAKITKRQFNADSQAAEEQIDAYQQLVGIYLVLGISTAYMLLLVLLNWTAVKRYCKRIGSLAVDLSDDEEPSDMKESSSDTESQSEQKNDRKKDKKKKKKKDKDDKKSKKSKSKDAKKDK